MKIIIPISVVSIVIAVIASPACSGLILFAILCAILLAQRYVEKNLFAVDLINGLGKLTIAEEKATDDSFSVDLNREIIIAGNKLIYWTKAAPEAHSQQKTITVLATYPFTANSIQIQPTFTDSILNCVVNAFSNKIQGLTRFYSKI